MADHRTEQSQSEANAENHRAALTEGSKCYECLRILAPICLRTACFGFVLLLTGIISLILFDGGEGRAITAGVGCVVLMFSLILYIIFKVKVAGTDCKAPGSRSANRGLDLAAEDAFWDISDLSAIVAVQNGESPAFHDETQSVPERRNPLRDQDVGPGGPTAVISQSSLFEDEELFNLEIEDNFEIPPSYEEATAASTTIMDRKLRQANNWGDF